MNGKTKTAERDNVALYLNPRKWSVPSRDLLSPGSSRTTPSVPVGCRNFATRYRLTRFAPPRRAPASLLGRNSGRHRNGTIHYAFDLKMISVRWSLRWRNPRVGQTSLAKRENLSVPPRRLSTSILSTRREVQILEANILSSGDEGRIYLHDARPLNAIHLSRGRGRRTWRGFSRAGKCARLKGAAARGARRRGQQFYFRSH